ncbi:MAG: outer membrane beta-barrel protein [Bacteroidaceae bacterium]|nr:outer membrane beta-barrel protein [Bacteroidaceae bacterium]
MKKIILTALVAVASLAANAQIWVGGEVGFSAGKTTVDGDKYGSGAKFNLIPEIGYTINDKFDVALAIGISHANYNGSDYEGTAGYEAEEGAPFGLKGLDYNRNAFKINPYVRYKFAKAGDFTFFVDGGFSYTMIHYSNSPEVNGEDNANQWGLGFKPGIAYNLSDKVSLVAHVGELSYNFYKRGDVKNNEFNMGVSGNNISFGAYVNF